MSDEIQSRDETATGMDLGNRAINPLGAASILTGAKVEIPAPKPALTLILGGSRSGKSRRAETLAAESGWPVSYLATCDTALMDDEMRARTAEHRTRRPAEWRTIENRFDLGKVLDEEGERLLLVDCLTLWLAWQQTKQRPENDTLRELDVALQTAAQRACGVILVSNELGMGIVPAAPETRGFRDLCGRANQLAASRATHVEFMIAGLPMVLKGGA